MIVQRFDYARHAGLQDVAIEIRAYAKLNVHPVLGEILGFEITKSRDKRSQETCK